ncbi:MAG: AgmX/PglI C-terminal domain-containing protein [Polyangiaceae bacterium]
MKLTPVLLSQLLAPATLASGCSSRSATAPLPAPSSSVVSEAPSASSTDADPLDAGVVPSASASASGSKMNVAALLSVDAGGCSLALPSSSAGTLTNASTDAAVERTFQDIHAVLRESSAKFRPCVFHANEAVRDGGMLGTLVLSFSLDAAGSITDASFNRAASDVQDEAAGACAVAVLRGLTFPASRRGAPTTVTYPLDFRPGCAGR